MKGPRYIVQIIVMAIGLLHGNIVKAQLIITTEIPDTMGIIRNKPSVLRYKKLPPGFEKQAIAALEKFPELRNVPIRFKVKKSFSTLKTRPGFFSMFLRRGSRKYIIIISNKSVDTLAPVLLANLPYEAQVGIIGHELSHVSDFSKRTSWQSLKIAINHFSPRYMDRLEYNTDLICIHHGLGKELETWSSYIRNTMHTNNWRGANYVFKGDIKYERYMNPSTIEKYITPSTENSHSTIENAW